MNGTGGEGKGVPMQIVYNHSFDNPYSLHDSRVCGIKPVDGNLRLTFAYGYVSTDPPFKQVEGDVLIEKVQIDDCDVHFLSVNGRYGDFFGKKMPLTDFLRDYPDFSFEILDEMYGYHTVSYQGYLSLPGQVPLIDVRLLIYYDGNIVYLVNERGL